MDAALEQQCQWQQYMYPIDLSTDDTFKVPISTVSCGHLVFLYGHYITIFSIVAETKFPSFQLCLVLRCASKLCIIINVS